MTGLRLAVVALAAAAAALVVSQKHLLTQPGPGLLLVLACAVPFALDVRWPRLRPGWVRAVATLVVAGCATALLAYRPTEGDTAVLFFVALVSSELLTSHEDTIGHSLTSAAEGTILTLAAVAPWLFAGVLIGLVIAMFNGLPQCVRDMHAALRVDPGLPAPPDSARG